MKVFALVLCLVVVAQALPSRRNVIPKVRTMPPVAGAPVYAPAKITNGQQATRGQFPYQVGLFLDDTHFCGGSIIAPTWILTAGHCGDGVRNFEIHAGAQNILDNSEGQTVVTSNRGTVHENYDSFDLSNDVCLIELTSALTYDNYIAPITLVGRTSDQFVGQTVRASGWGKPSDSATSISTQLNYVDLTVITNSECSDYYGSIVISSTLCTSVVNAQSTCNGDSGGPLVIGTGGTTSTQIGVVSFVSTAGCESGAPAGFARVSSFIDWIEANSGLKF